MGIIDELVNPIMRSARAARGERAAEQLKIKYWDYLVPFINTVRREGARDLVILLTVAPCELTGVGKLSLACEWVDSHVQLFALRLEDARALVVAAGYTGAEQKLATPVEFPGVHLLFLPGDSFCGASTLQNG
jgi:hypothetical protein